MENIIKKGKQFGFVNIWRNDDIRFRTFNALPKPKRKPTVILTYQLQIKVIINAEFHVSYPYIKVSFSVILIIDDISTTIQ